MKGDRVKDMAIGAAIATTLGKHGLFASITAVFGSLSSFRVNETAV